MVKSPVAWRAPFGDVAAEVIEVDTPGLGAGGLSTFCRQNVRGPIFPQDSFVDHAPYSGVKWLAAILFTPAFQVILRFDGGYKLPR